MEVDNFGYIKYFITTAGDICSKNHLDNYYEVQIIRRGKDHPDLPAANRYYMSFNIHHPDDLEKYRNEIISICKALKARAYIRIAPINKTKVMLKTLEIISKCLFNGDMDTNAHRCFLSAQGLVKPHNKYWILDVDTKDEKILYHIPELLRGLNPVGDKIISLWPTVNGWHIITKPFDTRAWNELCYVNSIESVEIKKNHLSLLYYYDER